MGESSGGPRTQRKLVTIQGLPTPSPMLMCPDEEEGMEKCHKQDTGLSALNFA